MNHLTLGIYPSKDYKFNVVRAEELHGHIEYNRIFRCGRLLYVDGKRVCNGCIKQEYLHVYDKIAEEFYASNTVDMSEPTAPYR